jgi:hypothetical protein
MKWLGSTFSLIMLFGAITLIGSGVLFGELGFYWDDWPYIWAMSKLSGPDLVSFAIADRPFMIFSDYAFFLILGESPLSWQMFTSGCYFSCAVMLWAIFIRLGLSNSDDGLMIAIAFLVFPGFLASTISVTYAPYIFQLLLVLISFYSTIRACEGRTYLLWLSCAVVTSLLSFAISEYFIGYEVARPFLIYWVLTKDRSCSRDWRKAFLRLWSPFAAALGLYLGLRLSVFSTNRAEVDPAFFVAELWRNPVEFFVDRFSFVVPDLIYLAFSSWSKLFDGKYLGNSANFIPVLVGSGVAVGVYFYLAGRLQKNPDHSSPVRQADSNRQRLIIMAGLALIILGMAPLWFSAVKASWGERHGGYALPAIIGCCLLISGIVQLSVVRKQFRLVVFSCLVFSGLTMKLISQQDFSVRWQTQEEFFRQLEWRLPNLAQGTTILVEHDVRQWEGIADYEMGVAVNFVYQENKNPKAFRYWVISFFSGGKKIESFPFDSPSSFSWEGRNLKFSGALGRYVVATYRPPNCLKILTLSHPEYEGMPEVWRHLIDSQSINLTGLEFDTRAGQEHTEDLIAQDNVSREWCYYYQKAHHAAEIGDLEAVQMLIERAKRLDLISSDQPEWVQFLNLGK